MYLGISYFTQHTDVIEVMGSEDATTCHVAVLRHTGMYGQNHVGLYHRYTWEVMGSEDATTCHVAVLRHTGMYGQNNYRLITAYLLLRVNLDKIMHTH